MSNLPPMPELKIMPGESAEDFFKRVDIEAEAYANNVDKYLMSKAPWWIRMFRIFDKILNKKHHD